ncbi:sulfatase [Pseudonocardia alni]|uniref:Arylsulfatase A-like enzyme n=1 Tax=Pseudonocardia alni TaxID=33907 RepID=A0A852WD48_PSEA5|nr:sulfatase [Pseudonocardia antarctica]NYG03302.1 arylsulfatase A-like enzyme [Pseudonocardia antarctica]
MRAIVVMFDSLNRRHLPGYGGDATHLPNFRRLAERTTVFDHCYAGSMPCMPARREMHTGRYNFLHRSWGPLEPFDDSVPQMLRDAGVHTHLVTDHAHYWEDGGATYHNRFSTYEFFRGQEGDFWKGQVRDPEYPPDLKRIRRPAYRQDLVNRQYLRDEADHPQTLTVEAGLHFLDVNHAEDRWMLQIEMFDPHEPFTSYPRWHELHPDDYDGPSLEWPDYAQVLETPEQVEHVRNRYAALTSMCDHSLGRVLDRMDALDLWDDTLLMVVTDHGYLLGEHGWWGKNAPPWYDETIHTPLFVWDPRHPGAAGAHRTSLVQTIDLGPTLLEAFGVAPTARMQGRALRDTVAHDAPVRTAGLFGAYGGHVSVTDGTHVYMRAPADRSNRPLAEYTLMPTHMMARFEPSELADAELVGPLPFTRGAPVLRTRGHVMSNPWAFGTLLFDLAADPGQEHPVVDDGLETTMLGHLLDLLRDSDAPPEQYERLGLPPTGAPGPEHLQVRLQWPQVEASRTPVRREDHPDGPLSVHTPLADLLADDGAQAVVHELVPGLLDGPLARIAGHLTLVEIAAFAVGVLPAPRLGEISAALRALPPAGAEVRA